MVFSSLKTITRHLRALKDPPTPNSCNCILSTRSKRSPSIQMSIRIRRGYWSLVFKCNHTRMVLLLAFFGVDQNTIYIFLVWCCFFFTLQYLQESWGFTINPHMCKGHLIIRENSLGWENKFKR